MTLVERELRAAEGSPREPARALHLHVLWCNLARKIDPGLEPHPSIDVQARKGACNATVDCRHNLFGVPSGFAIGKRWQLLTRYELLRNGGSEKVSAWVLDGCQMPGVAQQQSRDDIYL